MNMLTIPSYDHQLNSKIVDGTNSPSSTTISSLADEFDKCFCLQVREKSPISQEVWRGMENNVMQWFKSKGIEVGVP